MSIQYKKNQQITLEQFIELLEHSTLGQRRPIHDKTCLQGMLDHANLIISAWDEDKLVGIARCMTDFHYACYLSDLAVDEAYQNQGIGKQLQIRVQQALNEHCKLILISAPAANSYYEHIGFTRNERCWVLQRSECIK
ncbi:GNAT family N-acetyltransferase [Bermanella sp. WJH001]|uniref:GNAT family N-acetyltransferase n=1 Tax=Bermanella sp. WJH001 TaxID=3048005 RepID=UPI0024BEC1A9|nr:GNAT family N-acetyltransferase [Bermanella sp. WJH001]MDJ1536851.1 GNAT family N-acetyltransferase [Bermanella sp. WJH001]